MQHQLTCMSLMSPWPRRNESGKVVFEMRTDEMSKLTNHWQIDNSTDSVVWFWSVKLFRWYQLTSIFFRRCSGCRKRRSLRTNTFFAEFPKVPLVTLLKVIYYFILDDSQRRILRTLNLRASLVSRICRRLQDVCSMDLQTRPIIPFGGPGAVVKCDESKFNHKAKVSAMQKEMSASFNLYHYIASGTGCSKGG